MRDFPLVAMEYRGPSQFSDYFMFSIHSAVHHRTPGLREAMEEAEEVMRAWCWEQFGPPANDPTNESDSSWYCNDWLTFSFGREKEAFAFRVRWM